MTKSANIESIAKATGRSWGEWLDFLKHDTNTSHTDIARKVAAELRGKIDSHDWWAQGVTVAYEQHIGRRLPGQRPDGTFEFSVTKSLDGRREAVFLRVMEWAKNRHEFRGFAIENARTSTTEIRSYWRTTVADGTKLDFAVGPRANGGYMLAITQSKIISKESSDAWRSFWKEQLATIN
ncbi:MAG: hypothetical protein QG629_813 [Patescibacteria group bacterium]|nr:hypothetical protein [Patescibacteria group bacterium]